MQTRKVNHFGELLQQRRMRVLASDARAGSWARGQARLAQRQYLRDRRRAYSGFTAVLLIVAVVVAWLMPTIVSQWAGCRRIPCGRPGRVVVVDCAGHRYGSSDDGRHG